MVGLAVALTFISMAAVDVWTFWTIGHLPSPRPWRIVAVGLFSLGIGIGIWLGCMFTYQFSPGLRYTGFPIPWIVLHMEDGRWVDYVGLIPVVLPLTVFAFASCFLLPVSLGLVVRRLAIRPSPRPSALP